MDNNNKSIWQCISEYFAKSTKVVLKFNTSIPQKLSNSSESNMNNIKKSYTQASKINVEDIINIKDMFLMLSPKKIVKVNNIIKSNIVKPKIKMTTKEPLRKQVIVSMSQDNAKFIRTNVSFHINNINRHLKDANSKILANFIHIDKVGIIITTNAITSEQNMRIIKKAIMNSNKINKNLVESP